MNTVFHGNIEKLTLNESNFRRVLFTTPNKNLQLTLMSLKPREGIGMEMHPNIDQFIRVEKGHGYLKIGKENPEIQPLYDGMAVVIPSGTWHNIVNVSNNERFNLYSIYTPANHPVDRVQRDKPVNHEHFTALGGNKNIILGVVLIGLLAYFLLYRKF